MLVKQVIILSIIYFAIDFTTEHSPPIDILANTLIIWVAFLMFTKINETFTALCFLLLLIGYIMASQRNYLKQNKKKNQKQINKYTLYIEWIITLFTILLIVGFALYFIKQRKEHKKNWNVFKFIFGVHECGKL